MPSSKALSSLGSTGIMTASSALEAGRGCHSPPAPHTGSEPATCRQRKAHLYLLGQATGGPSPLPTEQPGPRGAPPAHLENHSARRRGSPPPPSPLLRQPVRHLLRGCRWRLTRSGPAAAWRAPLGCSVGAVSGRNTAVCRGGHQPALKLCSEPSSTPLRVPWTRLGASSRPWPPFAEALADAEQSAWGPPLDPRTSSSGPGAHSALSRRPRVRTGVSHCWAGGGSVPSRCCLPWSQI